MNNTDKSQQAQLLADIHYSVEEGITGIFLITSNAEVEAQPQEPIKLLEVNRNTIPTGVMPLYFSPTPASGVHYSSVIVEVTPEEFAKIQSQELALPSGWKVSDEPLPRPLG
ncbi:MAG: hypothetical protein KF708_21350, partial [Pirellulales bacterium]|nr:hypothetical protein [Pirellulales bacterium]